MDADEMAVMTVLKTVFGYENFKNDVQKEATITIYEGSKNVCVSVPPGHGKSLCFQLPVLLHKGKIGIVFSPKLSFIKGEIDFLRSRKINARLLSKSIQINEMDRIINDLMSDSPTIVLLYVTPEIGAMNFFKKLIVSLRDRTMLSYVVFTEAHCLSEWGYDYVPSYKEVKIFEMIDQHTPRIAITTAVTNKVIEDICELLKLNKPKIFTIPVQQFNVYYDVWFLDVLSRPINHLKSFIVQVLGSLDSSVQKLHKGLAIIYCREVVTAEQLNNKLNTLGISALAYHHKLHKNTRRGIESKWVSGEACVIVTTYDYGFIHSQTIRCIVYWTVPENIAKYYRGSAETQTAKGRAYCRIYFSAKEYSSVKLVIETHRIMNGLEHIKKRLNEYDQIVSHCLLVKCRHAIISKYFGHIIPPCESNCDVCENEETVEIRTLKFIMYSESVEGITYNICDVNEDIKQNHSEQILAKQLENTVQIESKESETSRKELAATGGTDKLIDLSNYKFLENERTSAFAKSRSANVKSAKGCAQTSTGNAVKYAEDNPATISKLAIVRSLLDKYNLNEEAKSWKPCRPRRKTETFMESTTVTRDLSNEHDLKNKSRIKVLSEHREEKAEKGRDRVSMQDSKGAILIGTKQSNKKSRKRFVTMDTCYENLKTKRRKLNADNTATIAIGIIKDGRDNIDSSIEHVKG